MGLAPVLVLVGCFAGWFCGHVLGGVLLEVLLFAWCFWYLLMDWCARGFHADAASSGYLLRLRASRFMSLATSTRYSPFGVTLTAGLSAAHIVRQTYQKIYLLLLTFG